MDQICDDLEAETQALAAVVENLTEAQWRAPTVAEGWDSHETVLHLGAADFFAHLTLTDQPEFAKAHERLSAGEVSLNGLLPASVHESSGADLWPWFRSLRTDMIAAFRRCQPKDRIAWIGPEIGAMSMASGRMMESWTHAHDLADTFGVDYPRTDRLRHVAHLGVVTRGFSYINRGLTPPAEPVRVELAAPSGDVWTWGAEGAEATVRGSAYEFCKVITHRQTLAESSLDATGDLAIEWMQIAQPWIEPPRISDRA